MIDCRTAEGSRQNWRPSSMIHVIYMFRYTLCFICTFIYVLLYSTLQIQKEIQKWFICPCSSKLYSRGILWEYNFFKRFWWTHVAIEYIWDWIWICLRAGLVLNWNWDRYNHKKCSLKYFEDKTCVCIHPPNIKCKTTVFTWRSEPMSFYVTVPIFFLCTFCFYK